MTKSANGQVTEKMVDPLDQMADRRKGADRRTNTKARVVIVDGHTLFRRGVRNILCNLRVVSFCKILKAGSIGSERTSASRASICCLFVSATDSLSCRSSWIIARFCIVALLVVRTECSAS